MKRQDCTMSVTLALAALSQQSKKTVEEKTFQPHKNMIKSLHGRKRQTNCIANIWNRIASI